MTNDPGAPVQQAVDYDPFAGGAIARAVPTTEPQREVWLADRLGAGSSLAYNEAICVRLRGALDPAALALALQDLSDRHEALRATFGSTGEELLILERADLPLAIRDAAAEGGEPAVRLAQARDHAVREPFDLLNGPLVRAELHRLAADDHALLVTAHHVVCDGWSFGVIARELGALYGARAAGGAPATLPPAPSFGDYAIEAAESARTPEAAADEAWWVAAYAGELPVLDLPLDHPRPARRRLDSRRVDRRLDAALVARARKLGAAHGVSLVGTLLAAFSTLLQRLTGSTDLVVGMPAAGQLASGHDGLVGHCVHLLPLRLAVDPAAPVSAHLAATGGAVLDAVEHQRCTYGTLLRKLAVPRDPSRPQLVSVMFNIDQALDLAKSGYGGLAASLEGVPRAFETFELFVNAVQVDGALVLECQYATALFDEPTIERWLACFEALLHAACEAPQSPLRELRMLPGADLARLVAWNDRARPFDAGALAHEAFEARAAGEPGRVAVSHRGETVTYGELDARANRCARAFASRGVTPGALVGLHLGRGIDMLASLLGALKCGAAYVPLDPAYPVDRLRYMVNDAALALLVTDSSAGLDLGLEASRVLRVDGPDALPEGDAAPARVTARDGAIAYVIYTSGSTGRPKGVAVPHRGVVNFLASMASEPGLGPEDRLLAVTTLSFDIAVNELLLPLSVGAQVVLASAEESGDGASLAALARDSAATVLQATPATWRMLLEAGWSGGSLRAWCGGEPLAPDLAEAILERAASLWNLYGPTETTVWSTAWRVPRAAASIRIGAPIANTTVWILDEANAPCPIGVPGEIWIGGEGVTAGYLGRPELTAERFVELLPDGRPARLYRTGDRGRWREDGTLEHLGRLDFQVKVRGYRIELGEIESALASHPAVARAVVVTREVSPGDVRLVAYVVAKDKAPGDGDLRDHLRGRLPDYMVPQHFVPLPAIPLLPNGKIDRRALPAPSGGRAAAAHEPPASDLERAVAATMESVLSLPGIGATDDFFVLGGHSLLAAQLARRLAEALGRPVPLRAVFEAPTARRMAEWLESPAQADAPEAAPGAASGTPRERAPLTPMQSRLWFLERLSPGRATWSTPSAHRLRGPLDAAAFERAFREVVRRQAALRTTIGEEDGVPYQRIAPEVAVGLLPAEDLSGLDEPAREAALRERLDALAAEPIDIGVAPLFRARLFRLGEREHVFYFCPHHIVWDGWSFDILYRELAALYPAFREGRGSPLAPLAVSYADFADWQRDRAAGPDHERQLAHWKAKLAGPIEPLAVPEDRPRPAEMSGRGGHVPVRLEAALAEGARRVAQSSRATPFAVLLAAYAVLLHQLGGQREVVIGVPVRGRATEDLEAVMGLFVNALPIRLRIDPARRFTALVEDVRDELVEAFGHPDVPFEALVRELKVPRDLSRAPVYQALFSFQDARGRERHWGDLSHDMIHVMQPGIAEDLSLWLMERPDGIEGGLGHNADIVEPPTARTLERRYASILARVLEDPSRPLDAIALADAERERLAEWNATRRPHPTRLSVPEWLASAAVDPARIAIEHGPARTDYGTLDADARRIARALRRLGAGRGERVGVFLPPGAGRVAAMLAALHSGAVTVPIDPALPPDRLRRETPGANLRVLVTDEKGFALAGLPRERALLLDADASVLARENTGAPAPDERSPRAEDPAWILDAPEGGALATGPCLSHRAVINLVASLREVPGLAPADRFLATGTPSRELGALESLLPLAVGATLVLADRGDADDPHALADRLARSGVTAMLAAPATWQRLLEAGWRGAPGFRAIVAGGEPLAPALAKRLRPTVAQLWNLYGPAGTSAWAAIARIDDPADAVTVGRPIANTQVHVLDASGRPCPIGIAGQVHVGGEGAAFTVPGGGEAPTGDRGRWRADGRLEFLGRLTADVPARDAAPAPAANPVKAAAPARAPMTPTESTLARIWSEILRSEDIRVEDNFFDIGGHSLLAMQAILAMEKATGKRIERNRYIFESLGQIAAAYDAATPEPPTRGGLKGMLAGLLGGRKG